MRNKKNKENEKRINLLKIQINNLKKEYQNNVINNNSNVNINNIINKKSNYPIINYRNNSLHYGINQKYVTSLNNEKSQRSLKTIDYITKKKKNRGRSTPFILKKISKNIPINKNKKLLEKKENETPYKKAPIIQTNKTLSDKTQKEKEKENYYLNNNQRIKNKLSKDNRYYNKSYKDLNYINNDDLIKKEERKGSNDEIGFGEPFIENGMSQNIINSNKKLIKNENNEEKEKNNNLNYNKNLLIDSQLEKKDKESVDNLKLFVNKLIDDLDK